MGEITFGYENLEACPVEFPLCGTSVGGFHRVKNRAVDFAVQVIDTVEEIHTGRKHYRLMEQIEASTTSVSMQFQSGSSHR